MNTLLPHIVIWAVLASVVIFLAVYRRRVDLRSDDMLHVLDGEVQQAATQVVVAKKLDAIDRWGKILTVLVFLYGLAIGGWYIYTKFTDTGTGI